jgi:hypothetical protein
MDGFARRFISLGNKTGNGGPLYILWAEFEPVIHPDCLRDNW